MVCDMRTVAIFVAAVLSLASADARAQGSKAWAAAKAGLPADATLVIGVDVAAIQRTQLFATLYPKLRDKPEVAKVLGAMKGACKVDPLANLKSVVVATSTDQTSGAVYLAVTGIDRARLSSCLVAASQEGDPGARVSIKQLGNITQLTEGGDSSYFGWIGKDVIVVSLQAEDKASLVKWMGGKGALARSALGRTLGKINTSAALWGAGEGSQEFDGGITLTGGYGAVTFTRGNLDADVHAVMASAAQAATMATTARGMVDGYKRGAPAPSPELGPLLDAVTIDAAGSEVVVKARFAEAALLAAVAPFLAVLGGM
jgi:predicted methyltransferase MtxX (methanogen marker protein 4)